MSTPNFTDKTSGLKAELQNVKQIMTNNVHKILSNTEDLEKLQNSTEDLRNRSETFKNNSKKLKYQMWWNNVKMYLIIAFIILLILGFLALIIAVSVKA
jgi:large-conductance mechanosensitive channel